MTIRCGCDAEGDEIVFGPAHQCTLPERTAMPGDRLPPLPSCAYPPDAEPIPCDLERPYERVLTDEDMT
jgi:hypothetical protein